MNNPQDEFMRMMELAGLNPQPVAEAAPASLTAGMEFGSLDKTGDFAGEVMYAAKGPVDRPVSKIVRVNGKRVKQEVMEPHYLVKFSDGYQDWYGVSELNIDPKSIRKPNWETGNSPDWNGW